VQHIWAIGSDDLLTESATFNPITPYGESKVLVGARCHEARHQRLQPGLSSQCDGIRRLAAPACRYRRQQSWWVARSPRARFESRATGHRGARSFHIEDISRAFLAVLEAPREIIHNQPFNVGQSTENYRISEIADMVLAVVPGSRVTYAEGGGPDPRCYRVDCSRIAAVLPAFKPKWTVPDGVRELYEAYRAHGLTYDEFVGEGSRYLRIRHIQRLQKAGRLTDDLRWTTSVPAGATAAPVGAAS
jgi:nucleoside-diphosphate-sugar epimerase